MIEILSTGFANTIQDPGRKGYLDQGVARGGAMDSEALKIANLMVGNKENSPAIEVTNFPFRTRFSGSCVFSITGAHAEARIGGRPLLPWSVTHANAGEELRIEAPVVGARIYLAFAGGIEIEPVLMSAATDLKGGYGGWHGRGLMRGDTLRIGGSLEAGLSGATYRLDELFFGRNAEGMSLVKVMVGAEGHWLEPASREIFFNSPLKITRDNNRQGMRLDCQPLRFSMRSELFSHGIMPGTIQVPPSGQPVIQLAEANTCGGYPKIAHVLPSELWKLAQARSGGELRFVEVSRQDALGELGQAQQQMQKLKNLMPVAFGWVSKREAK